MSLYQQNFTLLPVPPRSIFSYGDEATRFRLPDCASVNELRQFTTRLLILHIDLPAFYEQIYAGASIVCLLILIIILIVARRMYEQSFWLIRIVRRPTGVVIVPNALLAFTLCEGCFAAIFVAFLWEHRDWFKVHNHLPYGLLVWMSLTWFPLFCGPFAAVWGTYFATPSKQRQLDDEGEVRSSWWRSSFWTHAVVLNSVAILTPLLVFITVATPTMIGNVYHTRALHRQQRWLDTYNGQTAPTAFTQDMVHEVQMIWFDLVHGCFFSSVVFVLWVVYALCLAATYLWVSMRLLTSVREELRMSKESTHQLSMVATMFVVSEGQSASVVSRQEDEEVNRAVEQWARRNAQSPLDLDVDAELEMAYSEAYNSQHTVTNYAAQKAKHRPSVAAAPRHVTRLSSWRKFVPNVIAQPAPHPRLNNVHPSRRQQLRNLHKAYKHMLVQLCAIGPGCIAFAGLSFWAAIAVYSSTEQPRAGGGTQSQRTMPSIILTVTWAVVVLGMITMLAIAKRTYEPVLSSMSWPSSNLDGPRNGMDRSGERGSAAVRKGALVLLPHTEPTRIPRGSIARQQSNDKRKRLVALKPLGKPSQPGARTAVPGAGQPRTALLSFDDRKHETEAEAGSVHLTQCKPVYVFGSRSTPSVATQTPERSLRSMPSSSSTALKPCLETDKEELID